MRILLVEDEPEMADLIASLVSHEGFGVELTRSIDEASRAATQSAYDLILLDRRLPDGDGLSLLPKLRSVRPGVRIIVLSALDTLDDTVSGLDAGADDYLVKPFRRAELLARLRACLRRPGCEGQPMLCLGNLTFEPASSQAMVRGVPFRIDRRELALLEALMQHANQVITRESLLDEVYGRHAAVEQHRLDTLIWRLRRRLDALEAGVTIHLARGIGYMITETPA